MKNLLFFSFLFVLGNMTFAQNNSLNFDGTDDYVQTPYAGVLGNNPRTVEAWVKTTWNGTQRVIADWGALTPNGSRFTLNMINGFPRIEVGGNGVTGSVSIANGVWHHIAIVYDNSLATEKHKLYIDGVFNVSSNLTVAANTLSTNAFMIGRRVDGINYWQGNIDEVRVWNVARTAAQIAASKNTELTGNEAGLAFYAKMDETMAACGVVDCSPGLHHGSRLGATGANNLPQYSSDVPAGVTDVACGTCITNCSVACSIASLTVSNISSCSDNGTPNNPADDMFTADVTVNYTGAPATGTLDISGDGTASLATSSLTGCSHTFTGITMSADGGTINLSATFSAGAGCTLTNANAGTAPVACSIGPPLPCVISALTVSNISSCNNGGTPATAADDTFTADVTVTFANPLSMGTLDLTGDGTASVPVGSLGAGTYTFTGVTMSADGGPINLTVTFSALSSCTLNNSNAGVAPANCSINAPNIPTMGQWGLIIFGLLMFSLTVVFAAQQQNEMAMSGMEGETAANTSFKLPFDKKRYLSVLPFVYAAFAMVFTVAILAFGYEMTNADVPGSLFAGLIVAYLVQFSMRSSK